MAVQACVKQKLMDEIDMDDDDAPIVFRRSNTVPKQNQLNSETKKSSSQRHYGQSGKQVSEVQSPINGQNSISQKDKPKMMDEIDMDDDDDDASIDFKRGNTASKQNQLNSETKKSLPQRHDGQSGKQVSEVRSPNGQNSIPQKEKPVLSTKASPVKSPAASPKASTSSAKESAVKSPSASPKSSTSSAKASHMKSPVANSKSSTSVADQSKHSYQQNSTSAIKEEKQLIGFSGEPHSDSEDSEDDKPQSARLSAGLSKGNSNHSNRGPNASSLGSPLHQKPRVKHEDSDDEIPLSSKFQLKANAGPSTGKSNEFDENKYMAPKLQQNGSTMKYNQLKNSTVLNKRPLDEVKSFSQSSVKRPKLGVGSSPVIGKQASVKTESKVDDDDDDDFPVSQRLKKSIASGNKSLSAKQKVTKVVLSSFKKTIKKSKKVVKNSKYSKSSKVPHGSGEGQKWATLVHNDVIFPPPNWPHGVKMLYKGRPVNLTPEQEEVATMFAVMLETDYMNKPKFKENFMNDWRKILGKNHVIQRLEDCDFTPIYEWHQREKERKKQMSAEEIKLEPRVMCEPIDKKFTFRTNQFEDGDIICFQKSLPVESGDQFCHPDVPSFLKYVQNLQAATTAKSPQPISDADIEATYSQAKEIASSITSASISSMSLSSLDEATKQEVLHFFNLIKMSFEELASYRSLELVSCLTKIQTISATFFTKYQQQQMNEMADQIQARVAQVHYCHDEIKAKNDYVASIRSIASSILINNEKEAKLKQEEEQLTIEELELREKLERVMKNRLAVRQQREKLYAETKDLLIRGENGGIKIQAATKDLRQAQLKLRSLSNEWDFFRAHFASPKLNVFPLS